jgi:LysM repeat protein
MKKIYYISIFLFVFSLNGCAYVTTTVRKFIPRREPAEDKKRKIIDKYLGDQVTKGDKSFENQNYKQAKRDYLTLYFVDPTNKVALEKLRRLPVARPKKIVKPSPIQKTPVFAGKHITYTVKPGDTLAIIAQKFYGDIKKYTILAETNDIQSPYTLFEGQSIIVPKSAGGKDLEEHEKLGRDCFHTQDFDCTIREYKAYLMAKSDNEMIKEILKSSYHEKIKMNFDNGDYNETSSLLADLKEVASKYQIDLSDISTYITEIENNIDLLKKEQEKLLTAEKLLGEGGELQHDGMLNEAKAKYQEALKITNGLEQVDVEEMRKEITDLIKAIESERLNDQVALLTDEAVKNSYNEEYEEALGKIKKASTLDPQNQKVLELVGSLNNIVNLIAKAKAIEGDNPQQAFLYYKQAHIDIHKDFKQKSSRVEKNMIYTIHKLQKIAENKLNAEDPCGSITVIDKIVEVQEMVNIPYFIKNELQEIYSKSSSLKEALDIQCSP